MRPRFCPKCGKKGIKGDFCGSCSTKKAEKKLGMDAMSTNTSKKKIILKICPHCRKYFRQNKWLPFKHINPIITRTVGDAMEGAEEIIITENLDGLLQEMYQYGEKFKKQIGVIVRAAGEDFQIFVTLRSVPCGKCSRLGTTYYEGILQLRNPTEKILAFVKAEFRRLRPKGFFATQEKKVTNGIDFYVTSQKQLRNFGAILQKKFGGMLKTSAQLFTRSKQTSRDVYRLNVYFEAAPYGPGDVILCDGKLLEVLKRGKRFICRDLEKNKNFAAESKNLMNTDVSKIEAVTTKVVKVYPNIEVLHPETYQPVKVENAKGRQLQAGQKVKIIIYKNRAWVINA